MAYFLVGFGLAAHVLFWGAGLSLLFAPRPWRRWWPLFAAPAGLALQSAVVWAGAYAGLPGTDSYVPWAAAIPLVLLALALWRAGAGTVLPGLRAARGLGLAMAAVLAIQLAPMAASSTMLTTSSLGSCDAADYAAGARVLQEFSRDDRTGFLGLTEVVSLGSVDNFYDFWLRLNHFTPSALIALNGSALGFAPHQITGIMTAVLVALTMPAAFWLARAGLRHRPGASLWIAVIYGLNPLTWYAVAHVAMGQLLAAHGIALITWSGLAAWRGPIGRLCGIRFAGLLGMSWWLLLGSYNLILPVALIPALAYAGGAALLEGRWRRLGPWAVAMAGPLVPCCVLFADRVLGLPERYRLLMSNDFGWQIPVLTPEGWLGAIAGAGLSPLGSVPLRVLLGAGLLLLLVAAARRGRRGILFTGASLSVPIAVGYAYLHFRGATQGTNASYDAYKLLAVFFPGVLAGLCSWAVLVRRDAGAWRPAALAGIACVSVLTLLASWRFAGAMSRPPLIVDSHLVQLREIESRPEVRSVNMQIPDMWSRLWANAFLLRLPQYFPTHTYEGRRNTGLAGEWDIDGGVIRMRLPAEGTFLLNENFRLVDTRSPYLLRATPQDGWYDLEQSARTARRWRWTSGNATLLIANPGAEPVRTTWILKDVQSLVPRSLRVVVNGRTVLSAAVDSSGRDITIPELVIPPGGLRVSLVTDEPVQPPGRGDARPLAFRIFGVEIDVEARAGDAPPTGSRDPAPAGRTSIPLAFAPR